MHEDRSPGWRPATLLACLSAAFLVTASWLWPVTRSCWDSLDHDLFVHLNGSLAAGDAWQVFWAITNWRPFDIVCGLAILLVVVFWLRRERDRDRLVPSMVDFFLFALMLVSFNVVVQLLFEIIGYGRTSPTKVIESAVLLSDKVRWIAAKETSFDCFPGDHAFFLMSTAVFFSVRAGRRIGFAASLLFLPFIMPRLVSGAHWATDVLVGSVSMTLVAVGLWFATPLGVRLPELSCRRAVPVFQRLAARIPFSQPLR